jgi:DNA-binding beta-propeller fold protein YncE
MKKILFTAALLTLTFCGFAQTASQYKIANKIKLEGDMGWDYIAVDDDANRLYVSHGDRIHIVDLGNSNKVLATIDGLKGVHGIAIASEFNKGFISTGKDSGVTIFDLKTFAVLTKIKTTGGNPDAILYDSFSKKVFTFNGKSSNSTVIDAKTNAIVGTIDLPGKPEFAVSDGQGKIYDNLEDKNMICEIDASTMKVLNSWSIAPGDGPSGLAIDIKNRRLFSVCDKLMVIVDADNGKIIKTLPIGDRVDASAFDASLNRAYSSNGDGTLTVVQENSKDDFSVLENVTTQKSSRTCCVNSKTHHIYLPCAEFGPAPAPTAEKPKPKPTIIPGSFMVLDVEYVK